MRITDVLTTASIAVQVQMHSKDEVLDSLISLLDKTGMVRDRDRVRSVIYEREKIMSTGIGKGFAFPHAKTDAVNDTVAALITLSEPIEYESLDNQPVSIVFMLVGKENSVGTHLRLLSRVSRLMNSDTFRHRLLLATKPAEVLDLIADEEEQRLDV